MFRPIVPSRSAGPEPASSTIAGSSGSGSGPAEWRGSADPRGSGHRERAGADGHVLLVE
ncbi:hypothetical protein ACEZCY_19185 [Streptacidiphilus sp. N1-12]|uniref:Uncharacterized protein n=2 Tax=Streptacidiphilus alkalitolerans TaxID=3342712 RepID=A0ABV6VBM6_9ACTN